ncbi:hypothetical protein CEXT_215251 [Caerostris extrusa]|uniref:Uncharacterized protein n=1 Tax=Caerostris extrusa TaxID=172846 RepID=A0AAV4PHK8_CAEEX|nr:hypothetical protein CEXT_215251 [Caerostris extrusa]
MKLLDLNPENSTYHGTPTGKSKNQLKIINDKFKDIKITLSGALLIIYPADAHRSITTFLKKRVVNIRNHDNEIRVVNIDHRVANSAIY